MVCGDSLRVWIQISEIGGGSVALRERCVVNRYHRRCRGGSGVGRCHGNRRTAALRAFPRHQLADQLFERFDALRGGAEVGAQLSDTVVGCRGAHLALFAQGGYAVGEHVAVGRAARCGVGGTAVSQGVRMSTQMNTAPTAV